MVCWEARPGRLKDEVEEYEIGGACSTNGGKRSAYVGGKTQDVDGLDYY